MSRRPKNCRHQPMPLFTFILDFSLVSAILAPHQEGIGIYDGLKSQTSPTLFPGVSPLMCGVCEGLLSHTPPSIPT